MRRPPARDLSTRRNPNNATALAMSHLPAFPVIPIHPVPMREARQTSARDPSDDFAPPADIYARAVSGWYAGWRWTFVWLTQILFYGMPWLQWNGRQAVLFDLESQRFYILGLVLHPQDLIYLAALLVISALALFLFTAIAGRLWCGYSCPQTVYTEMFMWVERKLEGDRVARMRLDKAPWGLRKMARKSAKQVAWLAIGLDQRLHGYPPLLLQACGAQPGRRRLAERPPHCSDPNGQNQGPIRPVLRIG